MLHNWWFGLASEHNCDGTPPLFPCDDNVSLSSKTLDHTELNYHSSIYSKSSLGLCDLRRHTLVFFVHLVYLSMRSP